jgi:hypothetical protein
MQPLPDSLENILEAQPDTPLQQEAIAAPQDRLTGAGNHDGLKLNGPPEHPRIQRCGRAELDPWARLNDLYQAWSRRRQVDGLWAAPHETCH